MLDKNDSDEDKKSYFCPDVHDLKGHTLVKVPQREVNSKWACSI